MQEYIFLIIDWFFFEWTKHWMWFWSGACIFTLAFIGPLPLSHKDDEVSLMEVLKVRVRILLFAFTAILLVFIPLGVLTLGTGVSGRGVADFVNAWKEVLFKSAAYGWAYLVLGGFLGWGISFLYARFFAKHVSAFFRFFRVRQHTDELSDIRDEADNIKLKNYLPSKYYKNGEFFLGLDDTGKPVYEDDKTWNSWNQKIIGPTQTGKGVFLGVQVDQAIRKGQCVFVIDPKPDFHLKAIMKKACRESHREFVALDLNNGNEGKWAPFTGGIERDRRARLYYAFGLNDTGKESDFYKTRERAIIDKILFPDRYRDDDQGGMPGIPKADLGVMDWKIDTLLRFLDRPENSEELQRTIAYLFEWRNIDSLMPQGEFEDFSIERALLHNKVVYVRASLTDRTILKAAAIFIMETVQEIMRLHERRQHHAFLMVDEVKFMISDQLAKALATCVGFNSNISIAYQSIMDLRSLEDSTLNAASVEDSVNVNCKLTLCYMAANTETAQWASDMSGTQIKSVTGGENVKVKRHGTEQWTEERSISKQETALISANQMRMLPQRVGVLYRPAKIADMLFTAWVPVTDEEVREATAVVANDKAIKPTPAQPAASTATQAPQPKVPAPQPATNNHQDDRMAENRQRKPSNRQQNQRPKPKPKQKSTADRRRDNKSVIMDHESVIEELRLATEARNRSKKI